jgi:hypothetical protein
MDVNGEVHDPATLPPVSNPAVWTPETVQTFWRSWEFELNFFRTLISHDQWTAQSRGTYVNSAATAEATAVCPPAAVFTAVAVGLSTVRAVLWTEN